MNEIEIIQDARGFLSDPKKWQQKATGPLDDARCVMGALGWASVQHRLSSRVYDSACALVRQHVPGGLIGKFNDDPDTTHADILNVLDKTLADLGAL